MAGNQTPQLVGKHGSERQCHYEWVLRRVSGRLPRPFPSKSLAAARRRVVGLRPLVTQWDRNSQSSSARKRVRPWSRMSVGHVLAMTALAGIAECPRCRMGPAARGLVPCCACVQRVSVRGRTSTGGLALGRAGKSFETASISAGSILPFRRCAPLTPPPAGDRPSHEPSSDLAPRATRPHDERLGPTSLKNAIKS